LLKQQRVNGAKAFELYDTFGFPIDLTALILRERGFSLTKLVLINLRTKSRSRASEVSTDDWKILVEGNTESFVGYDQVENEVKITRIRKVDSKKECYTKSFLMLLSRRRGQVGDKGTLVSANETIEIIDTRKKII
jgi:alanyl-tRNA synthetase